MSDILMPRLDGFALSRALRRDVALRDVPVILLSWKEDLLQRVRELGASAAAYMRKESDSRAILARVREVLRPRARIEMRLRGDGEVRGRLDGLTARLLLELVGTSARTHASSVRDASYLYEIESATEPRARRRERLATATTRAASARSPACWGSARAVRRVAEPRRRPRGADRVARRAARKAPRRGPRRHGRDHGRAPMQVERIGIDEAALEEYLHATPEPARSLIRRVAGGESPRQMLLGGDIPPSLFEDVVADLAARGAIRVVQGANGVDLLGPAIDAASAVLRGAPKALRSTPPNARASVPVPTLTARPLRPASLPAPSPPTLEALRASEAPPASGPVIEEGEAVPSSLEDAVMRELSDRSPAPGAAHVPASNPPPIVEPSELRPRSSNPPAHEPSESTSEERLLLPSIPPDAVVPAAISSEELAATPASSDPLQLAAPGQSNPDDVGNTGEATGAPPRTEVTHDTDVEGRYEALLAASTQPMRPGSATPAPLEKTQPLPIPAASVPEKAPEPEVAPAPQPAPEPAPTATVPGRSWLGWALVAGAVAVIAGVALNTGHPSPPALTSPESRPLPAPPSTAPPPVPSAPTPGNSFGDLPPGTDVPAGFGRIEVSAPVGARIRVDGAIAGAGPALSAVAAPGYHEVRVEGDGGESKNVIEVRAGKTTRIDSAAIP